MFYGFMEKKCYYTSKTFKTFMFYNKWNVLLKDSFHFFPLLIYSLLIYHFPLFYKLALFYSNRIWLKAILQNIKFRRRFFDYHFFHVFFLQVKNHIFKCTKKEICKNNLFPENYFYYPKAVRCKNTKIIQSIKNSTVDSLFKSKMISYVWSQKRKLVFHFMYIPTE